MKKICELHEIKVRYDSNFNDESIKQSKQAYEVCKTAYALSGANICLKEYFFMVFLNRANNVIGYYKLSEGGISGTVVDIRLAFSIALKVLASGIILCHNHPSSTLSPSHADIMTTRKFKKAAELLDFNILDHIILSKDYYMSMADEGFM